VQAVIIEQGKDEGGWQLSYKGTPIERSTWVPDERTEGPVVSVLCLCIISGMKGMEGLTVANVKGEKDEYVRTGVFYLWSFKEENEEDGEANSKVDGERTDERKLIEEEGKEHDGDDIKGDDENGDGKGGNGDANQRLIGPNGEGEEVNTVESKEAGKNDEGQDEDKGKLWFRPPPPFEELWELGVEMGRRDDREDALAESLGGEEIFWLV